MRYALAVVAVSVAMLALLYGMHTYLTTGVVAAQVRASAAQHAAVLARY